MHIGYPYLKGSVEESNIYPNGTPSTNVTNSNGVQWMGNSHYNDTNLDAPNRYSRRTLYTNTLGWPPVPLTSWVLTLANKGYTQPFFHIQNKLNRVIQTSFLYEPASWNQHFQAVPYNFNTFIYRCPSLDQQRHDRDLVHTGLPGCSWSNDKQRIHPGMWVARNIIPYQQKLFHQQLQLLRQNCDSQGQDIGMEFSSTKIRRERKEKYDKTIFRLGQRSPFVEKDMLSENMCPVHKNEVDEIWISGNGQVLNNSSNSFASENKSAVCNITSGEEDNNSFGKKTSKFESTMHSPNPNGRGRSAPAIQETLSTLSFETKEAEIMKEPMFSSSPSERALSDEIIRSFVLLTPASQKAVSDVVSTLDFVMSPQSSSESNCEVTESSSARLLTMGVTTPELSSKPTVSKPLPFIIEPTIKEDKWNIVSHRKKRKNVKAVPVKPFNPSPLFFSELALSDCSIETQKRYQKPKKKNRLKPSEQNNFQTTLIKKADKPKDSSETLGTKRKRRKSSCTILGEYIFDIIILWSIKRN